jgi:hypothetical protein
VLLCRENKCGYFCGWSTDLFNMLTFQQETWREHKDWNEGTSKIISNNHIKKTLLTLLEGTVTNHSWSYINKDDSTSLVLKTGFLKLQRCPPVSFIFRDAQETNSVRYFYLRSKSIYVLLLYRIFSSCYILIYVKLVCYVSHITSNSTRSSSLTSALNALFSKH